MSLLTEASLVILPNAVKEGELFSIIPADGSGDMTAVRATTATLVNSEKIIEDCPYNLLQRSEEFENAYWVKNNISVTANNTSSPSGTMTADLVANTLEGGHINNTYFVGSIGSVYSFSFYIKNNTSTNTVILVRDTSTVLSATINWSGANISSITNTVGSISSTALTNGWFLIRGTYTAVENNQKIRIYPQSGSGTNSVFLWGAQLEKGSTAKPYFKTTDRLNVPRLDYTNGSCPSILVEPQRTNLVLRSEEFDNATWTKTNSTITANATTSPSGTMTADKIIETAASSIHSVSIIVSFPVNTVGCISLFCKKSERSIVYLGGLGRTPNQNEGYVWFDLNNGTVLTQNSGYIGKIEYVGNEWYRISVVTPLMTSSVQKEYRFGLTTTNGIQAYTGDGTSGVFIWGAQLEVGSNATSYIPTVASAVTRNADVISKSGISSLINSEEGCFFVEANSLINGGAFRQFALSNGTDNSRLTIGWSSIVNTLLIRMDVAGVTVVSNNITSFNQTSNNKILIKWGGGNLKTFVNGVERLSLTSLTMPTANLFTKLGFDRGVSASFFEGNVKSVLVFPTQLTDQQCIELTTL